MLLCCAEPFLAHGRLARRDFRGRSRAAPAAGPAPDYFDSIIVAAFAALNIDQSLLTMKIACPPFVDL
jgi:hypothetical protein